MALMASLEDHQGRCIAGLDEAGRGPLAGDVVAAAVIPGPAFSLDAVNDSKKLTARQRKRLYHLIIRDAQCYAVGRASVAEIDHLNILRASLLAMQRALEGLSRQPDLVYVDGLHCPQTSVEAQAIPGGDGRIAAIAAASIIAKVERDRDMLLLEERYPGYGFARHKGYPTRAHIEALVRLGPCDVHRRSFGPVARQLRQTTIHQATGETSAT
ncbi:MAG: ribonuclease HII [Pseudohongiellaceae bacterium]